MTPKSVFCSMAVPSLSLSPTLPRFSNPRGEGPTPHRLSVQPAGPRRGLRGLCFVDVQQQAVLTGYPLLNSQNYGKSPCLVTF